MAFGKEKQKVPAIKVKTKKILRIME